MKIASNGINELMQAASKGDLATLQRLLATGVAIDERDIFGNTALIYAVSAGHYEAVSLLLRQGADITLTKPNGLSILDIAASNKYERLLHLLRNARFFAAARVGDYATLTMLLEEGVDVNIRSQQGWNALMVAAVNGHSDAVHVLLNFGSDTTVRDERGWTAATLAAHKGHQEIARFLDPNAKTTNLLHDVSAA